MHAPFVSINMRIKSLSVTFHIKNFYVINFGVLIVSFNLIGVADMGQVNNRQINGLIIMHWKENVEII